MLPKERIDSADEMQCYIDLLENMKDVQRSKQTTAPTCKTNLPVYLHIFLKIMWPAVHSSACVSEVLKSTATLFLGN